MRGLKICLTYMLFICICIMTSSKYAHGLTTEEVLDTTEVSVRIVYTNEYRRELAKEGIFLGNSEIGVKIPASYFKDYEDNIVYQISNNGNVSVRWKNIGKVKLRDVLPNSTEEEFIEAISQSNSDKENALGIIISIMLSSSILIVVLMVMQNRFCTDIEKPAIKGDQDSWENRNRLW